ncbi:helix-turn-helix domain-containing protein [Vibrio owensii]|uniref:helix-turn-helix domain-containing protein n=1 Tax=Vibrio owensii TaxID=696485 RepID=UPI003AAAEEB4
MFGRYLKQLRLEKGLTQKELCIHLNFATPELAAVDAVTVSRWERETTTPHPVRAIKILRALTNDLMPYLSHLKWIEEEEILNRVVYERFYSTQATIRSASYSKTDTTPLPTIIEKTINPDTDRPLFESILHFLRTSQTGYPGLETLNLSQLYREKKLLLNVYVDPQSLEVVGHNLAVFFDCDDLGTRAIGPYHSLPFNKLKPYTRNSALAICSLSRFASSEAVFDVVHSHFVRFIATHANIHFYYHYLNSALLLDYLVEIGAEKVGYDTPDPYGAVKIGNRTFRNGLLRIESAVILSRPEIVRLLNKSQINDRKEANE